MGGTRPSSIDRLPLVEQEVIARLRREGGTIDEIRAELAKRNVEVSRSALGRHIQHIDGLLEQALVLRLALGEVLRSLTPSDIALIKAMFSTSNDGEAVNGSPRP